MMGMGGDEEDEFSFDPADLGDDAHEVPDHGKTADLSNLFGGMGVSPDDEAPDMGMGDDEEGADISSLFGGAGDEGGDDSGNPFGGDDDDSGNPFGGEDDSAPEGEADDENIDDELDQDMDDDAESDEGGDEEAEAKDDKKFMGKGWANMKKEAKEFPAFLKKGKGKDKDEDDKKGGKKAPPFGKKKAPPFGKKDDKKGGFELFKKKVDKKKTKEEEKVEENSFLNSLTRQASGTVRKLKEDSLVAQKQTKREPGPGEVGYAPSGRVGQMPTVASYNEWKAKNFPKKK
jgi:hypothetical protein